MLGSQSCSIQSAVAIGRESGRKRNCEYIARGMRLSSEWNASETVDTRSEVLEFIENALAHAHYPQQND